ncbi:MAG: hypothetical protein AAGB46_12025, partial [Verrucomicrobiota bacterium]
EDLRILSALGIKLLRTYNTQQFAQAAHLLKAIRELKAEDPSYEMYIMLGAWIECEGAWTAKPNHNAGNFENNSAEIAAAIRMANEYPDIVKVIAVGNEAMVHWASGYFVAPSIIHKWVVHLQELKAKGELPQNLWITSSDNYESWGGGAKAYHSDALEKLIRAVDFISLHTYPFHDSHYRSDFWGAPDEEASLSIKARAEASIQRAVAYAKSQYQQTADYIKSLGIDKPIHIGETGWASIAAELYGATGSQAADEYKGKLYYDAMREWTESEGMSCFYFEAFDERWKDPTSPRGSENHFGLINLQGQAKYALWEAVDAGLFDGLSRDGSPITKTFAGDESALISAILPAPLARNIENQAPPQGPNLKVSFSGRKLLVNGEEFFVRGVCYQPTPIGEDASQDPPYGDYFTSDYRKLYERDIVQMRDMGANVVRIYGWDSTKGHNHFLDTLFNDGERPIRVLLNLWIDPETDWQDSSQVDAIADRYVKIAQNVGNHPAVLGYLISNETNAYYGNGEKPSFWKAINQVAKALKTEAPDRLVSVAITDALAQVDRFDQAMSHIDAWSIQVYRGLTLGNFYEEYAAVSEKPLLVTEFGLDAFDSNAQAPYPENGKFVAEIVGKMIIEMERQKAICSGGCIFEFGDEWWKSKGSASVQDPGGIPNGGYPDKMLNEEWWGIFAVIDDNSGLNKIQPRELFFTLKRLWAEAP